MSDDEFGSSCAASSIGFCIYIQFYDQLLEPKTKLQVNAHVCQHANYMKGLVSIRSFNSCGCQPCINMVKYILQSPAHIGPATGLD
jgi:hypothetical protein